MTKTLYFNEEKDYKRLLEKYYCSHGKDWLFGYVACLYGSMIIDEEKRLELNSFIEELKDQGGGNLMTKSAKVTGHIPIDPDRLDYIKKRIGRKKLDVGETYNQISGESFREYRRRRKAEMGDKENEAYWEYF